MTHYRQQLDLFAPPSNNVTCTCQQTHSDHCPTIGEVDRSVGCSCFEEVKGRPALVDDSRTNALRLCQYYTQESVAEECFEIVCEHFDLTRFLIVEPSAGTGAFFKLFPAGCLGFDIEPKYPGVQTADYLTVEIGGILNVAVIGNPPFGKNASLAVRFFNHAARQSSVIAMIMPRSIKKAAIENRLDRDFHLLREKNVPADSFLFQGKPFDVAAVFQIWERRLTQRQLQSVETMHPDFEFTTATRANFAIQRVGARAGRVHHNFTASPNSHYFIRGNVEARMRQLDFASVTGNVAGNPSLSKSEIILLYSNLHGAGAPEGHRG